jgi:hypothetical protein
MTDPDPIARKRWLRRGARIAWRAVGDEAVVLDTATATYYALNPTGAVLWQAMEEPADAGHLTRVLTRHFAVDEDTAVRDVAAFLARMAGLDLVRAEPGPS